ncbi:MAG: hypothetical protein JOZ27_04160 [Caulobacteraceae bacterium]|nr:hypothetical protein [Caulobacteraceae bacterium]
MSDDKSNPMPMQGEGAYDAARKYDAEQAAFAKSGKAEAGGKAAKDALDGPEGAELERARIEAGQGKAKSTD